MSIGGKFNITAPFQSQKIISNAHNIFLYHTSDTLPAMDEEHFYFVINWNVLQGWYISYILWNAKHFSMFVEKNYLIWFGYMVFLILINPFPTNPRYCQICVNHISTKSASRLDRDELKTDLMLTNMTNYIFPLIWKKKWSTYLSYTISWL